MRGHGERWNLCKGFTWPSYLGKKLTQPFLRVNLFLRLAHTEVLFKL